MRRGLVPPPALPAGVLGEEYAHEKDSSKEVAGYGVNQCGAILGAGYGSHETFITL
jgi:hypothetical protein